MKCLVVSFLILALPLPLLAQEAKAGPAPASSAARPASTARPAGLLGARYPHVSPDGRQIAFSLHGDLWVMPAEGGRATRLTLNEANDVKPRWSPDGKKIAFTSDRSGNFDVWIMPADGGVPTQLTFYSGTDHVCGFTPDGRWILFQSSRSGRYRIYRVSVKGGTPTPVTLDSGMYATMAKVDGWIYYQYPGSDSKRKGYRGSANDEIYRCRPGEVPERLTRNDRNDRLPHISPDGKKLYFLRETGKSGTDYNLHVMDLSTKERKVTQLTSLDDDGMSYLTFDPAFTKAYFVWKFRIYSLDLTKKGAKPVPVPVDIVEDTRREPVAERTLTSGADGLDLSRDGKRIVFSLGGGLWLMDSGGGEARPLTPVGSGDHAPRFSPDGRRVAFYSTDRTGNPDLFVIDVTGENLRRLTFHERGDFFQSWSPDGSYLVFTSERAGNKDIWKVALDGTPPEQLTKTPYNDDDPCVSPDGRFIAFDSWANGRADIYLMNADGSGVRLVYGTPAQEESPRFSPDGRLLVFTRTQTSGTTRGRLVVVTDFGGSGEIVVGKGSGGTFTPDGREILYLGPRGRIKAVPAPQGILGGRTISFIAKQTMPLREQFTRAFQEAWKTIRDRFYDPRFHGVNWNAVKAKYEPIITSVKTRMEFYYYMTEMIGELKASHQGIGGTITDTPNHPTGGLGCELIPEVYAAPEGPGRRMLRLRVAKVDVGGPADQAWIREGDYVFGIAGKRLTEYDNLLRYLTDKIGEEVKLLVGTKPDGSDAREVTVKPESSTARRRREYRRWVDRNRSLTRERSRRKVAYIHIQAMNGTSLRRFQAELGSPTTQRAKALVLDVRNNPGGNIHQQLIDILSRRHYANNRTRTRRGKSPSLYWERPIVLLVNERSFSDAEVFAHAFKTLGLGTIVGVPTPGAVIGTINTTLSDGSRFRVTLSGFYNLDGTDQEGHGCVPDVVVEVTAKDRIEGNDPQLEKAIEIALAKIAPRKPAKKPAKKPTKPAKPSKKKPAAR